MENLKHKNRSLNPNINDGTCSVLDGVCADGGAIYTHNVLTPKLLGVKRDSHPYP